MLQIYFFLKGPYRHYILNALWIMINLLCIFLTLYQLKRLYRDFTTKNLAAVRIAGLFTSLLSIQTEVRKQNPTEKYQIQGELNSEFLLLTFM